MKKIIYYLAAIIAGGLLPLAFAPLELWPLAIVSLLLLLVIWREANPWQAFRTGFCYGLGMFGVGVSWIYVSIHDFGYTSATTAILLTALFVITLSLFIATSGLVFKKIYHQHTVTYACIGFPCVWVLFELLRSWFLTGFPWLLLGYSQTSGPLIGWGSVVGVYGLSFFIALSSGLLYLFIIRLINIRKTHNFKPILISISIIGLIWGAGIFSAGIQWTKPTKDNISVAILQGNIAPDDKFLLKDTIQTVDGIYGKMTRENLDADLIIWPENSLPLPLPESEAYITSLRKLITNNNSSMLLGVPIESELDGYYYNALLSFGSDFLVYHKKKLVPFGEFVPLENILRGLINFFDLPMSSFIPGKDANSNILNTKFSKVLALICYEIAYPQVIRNSMKGSIKPEVLVTISEDGWFGNSWGPHQHLQIAKMRAIETGRYVLRATTSGISAVISPTGKVIVQSPQFEQHILRGEYNNMSGSTPWLLLGVIPFIFFLLFLGFIGRD